MTENPDRIERTLELLVYAPIGIGLFLKDTAPTFVNMFVARGRAEVDRRQEDAQQRVTTARSLGQVAIAFGPPVVRQRVGQTVGDACRRAESLLGSVIPGNGGASAGETTTTAAAPTQAPVTPTPTPTPAPAAPVASVPAPTPTAEIPTTNGDAVAGAANEWRSTTPYPSTPPIPDGGSAALPIPGYDALSASQVVERLTGLTGAELDAVHAYEMANRQRRTILGKIEQLAG